MDARSDYSDAISSVEELLEEARNGRMFILVDHEDRENEGDLVIAAQFATPDAINFMATHGRGLICLALPGDHIDRLGLPLMASANQSRHETAFTVSIEAREGVTTGISAHDRARTIAVAIDPRSTPQDLATPGHVFPLRARDGGVLVRAGHTEAAVDIPRLAGLAPAGVICEIMNDDGTMARLPDLVAFAQRHNLKIGTIADLIAHRRRHDNLIRPTAEERLDAFGVEWRLKIFSDAPGHGEHIALVLGDVAAPGPVLTRMHVLDPLDDVIGFHRERADLVPAAMQAVAAEGRGVVVLLRDLSPTALTERLRPRGASPTTLRQYGVGAQILLSLGVRELILLTNSSPMRIVGIEGYGLSVAGVRPLVKGGL
ncbi:MAG: 3,4-dihydroxy-2-butanone-4-phosphate synthase [Rubrimonas sp.]